VTESRLPMPVCRVFAHPFYRGVRLVGELDLANRSILLGALAVLAGEADDVHLDISELGFIDVGGLAEIVAFAEEHRPHRVIVDGPSALVRRVVDAAWGDGALDYGE
jgi:ABC-type transporter Mla MlaB component